MNQLRSTRKIPASYQYHGITTTKTRLRTH